MKVSAPFNDRIPRDVRANLEWRSKVYRKVIQQPSYANVLVDACRRDPLFFINGFGFTYDPRCEPFTKVPFILYPYQEEAIIDVIRAFNDHDLLIEKTRDMGASWICVSAIAWAWRFKSELSFLMVSRVEDYVDKAGNPKALFWKFDYLVDNMPGWLQPQGYDRNKHRSKGHALNPETGSVVDGEATTGNTSRGDRRTAELFDEFAAVEQGHKILAASRDSTRCRLFNSTPEGTDNAFYDMRETSIRKLRLHWSSHPLKAAGLYRTAENGTLEVLDLEGYPEGYEPILDGKLRSPWYDNECSRAASAQEIAQELDIDYLGSGFQFFQADRVYEAIRKFAKPPIVVGDLDYDTMTAEFTEFRENSSGRLSLWCLLNRDGLPPRDHRYVVAVDVSAGTGASNSAIVVWDMANREKVAEYVNPFIRPEELAKQAHAIAGWFSNMSNPGIGRPRIIWESSGPGRQFGDRLLELGYGNVYLQVREESLSKKVSDIPGWAPTRDGKKAMLGAYRAAVELGVCVNRSKLALEETLEYIFTPDGRVEHSRSTRKIDPSGAKSNHGDLVIADALAWKLLTDTRVRRKTEPPKVPIGCLAWRNEMRDQQRRDRERDGW